MTFDLLPAIDVLGGRLARYRRTGLEPVKDFGGDPLAAARSYAEVGARWVHIVDLDLAYEGTPHAAQLVRSVVGLGMMVQASGGVRRAEDVGSLIAAGASRVVLGSAVLTDEDEVEALLERFGAMVWPGIEASGDRIRSRGSDAVDLDLVPTLGWLTAAGAHGFVVTAVDRVSEGTGPDTSLIRRVARSGRPVVAAGGIATLEHLASVRSAGASGAIVGRAALEGSLDLGRAIRRLR